MSAIKMDGKAVTAKMNALSRERAQRLRAQGIEPHLAVILVGDDPASQTYVGSKERACMNAGIRSTVIRLPGDTTQETLINKVQELNADKSVHGILVQLPLPKHIDESRVLGAIDPDKDVDGFHPVNVGRMLLAEPCFLPCTPAGIVELLRRTGVQTRGAEAVVVGRSNIVGKPVACLLARKGTDATVTLCHSATPDLAAHTRRADILVVAAGRPKMVTADMVKPGAVVIDVGVNRIGVKEDGRAILAGDVDFEAVKEKAAAITPVPGGVGPMTITMLMANTVLSAERATEQNQKE